jgi:hypothetical protein
MEARTILMCEANEHVDGFAPQRVDGPGHASPHQIGCKPGGRPCQVAADAVNRFPITSISFRVAVVGRAELPRGGWSRTRTRSARYRLWLCTVGCLG